jgi:triosephosphate isomerase
MTLFIRKVLRNHVSAETAKKLNILYGGSVKKANAKELFVGTGTDGFLVGGASLEAAHFCDILRTVNDLSDELSND